MFQEISRVLQSRDDVNYILLALQDCLHYSAGALLSKDCWCHVAFTLQPQSPAVIALLWHQMGGDEVEVSLFHRGASHETLKCLTRSHASCVSKSG